jgi:hypothetical protein
VSVGGLDERNGSLVAVHGVTVPELHRSVVEQTRNPHTLPAGTLAGWLLRERLATLRGDELVPTRRGLEAGGPLE